ncbi:MAG: 2-C-methyl-D-erythritol 4-phosphate cytidylyltransferase [Sedimentisphaeraceae bacterium JB056]
MNIAVIICAAGSSTRFGGKTKKIFEKVCETPVFLRSINVFSDIDDVKQIILAISPEDEEKIRMNWEANLAFDGVELCHGGSHRGETVEKALANVRDEIDLVAVHDAARCCVTKEWVLEAFEKCSKSGAVALACPVVSTIKKVVDGQIAETVDRINLYEAQTPQVFNRTLLIDAYENIAKSDIDAKTITDDCSVVEKFGHAISIVETDSSNIKITKKDDISIAEAILKSRTKTEPKAFHPFADDKW